MLHYLDTLDVHDQKIINLATPTLDTDASTKKYVDDIVSGQSLLQTISFLVGDNSATTFVLTHNLGTKNIDDTARFTVSGEKAYINLVPTTINTATLTLPVNIVLDTDELTVTIVGKAD
jgi:hypothetical protein